AAAIRQNIGRTNQPVVAVGCPSRLSKAAVAIKNPGSNSLPDRIPANNFPPIGLRFSSSKLERANEKIFVSRPVDLCFDVLISALVLPGPYQPFKDRELGVGVWWRCLPFIQLGNLPMIAFP